MVHVNIENERSTAADSRCRRSIKYANFTSSSDRLRQKLHQKACRTCSTIIFPHSTNQIIDLWRCLCRCRSHFLNSLFSCEDGILLVKRMDCPGFFGKKKRCKQGGHVPTPALWFGNHRTHAHKYVTQAALSCTASL